MEDFTFNGKTVGFWEISGDVISSDKFSETHVYSQGGGSSAPSVHSNVVTKQEFWLKTIDGVEKSIQLAGADVPLRLGQKVTVIAAQLRGNDSSACYVALVNNTAKTHQLLFTVAALNRHFQFVTVSYLGIATVWVVFGASISLLQENSNLLIKFLGFLAVLVTLIYSVFKTINFFRKIFEVVRVIPVHLDNLAKSKY